MKSYLLVISFVCFLFPQKSKSQVAFSQSIGKYKDMAQLEELYKDYGSLLIINNFIFQIPCECSPCRNLGGGSDDRNLGGSSDDRNLGGDSDDRKLGGGSDDRNLGGDSDDRDMKGQITQFSCKKTSKTKNEFTLLGINPNSTVKIFNGVDIKEVKADKVKL